VIFCGTGNNCEGGAIEQSFGAWVIAYWQQTEGVFSGIEAYALAMLAYVLSIDWSASQTLAAFHIGFIDTVKSQEDFVGLSIKDVFTDALQGFQDEFWALRASASREIDTLIGYSAGGVVAARILGEAASRGYSLDVAILIQPSFRVGIGNLSFGFDPGVSGKDVPGTRILTLNDTTSLVGGTVHGSFNLSSRGHCGGAAGHCTHSSQARMTMRIALTTDSLSSANVSNLAAFAGMRIEYVSYPPSQPWWVPPILGAR
jgi:hypothetical protein